MKNSTVFMVIFIVVASTLFTAGVITGNLNVDISGSLFFGKSEEPEPEHVDYIIEWINGCYVIKHKDINTLIGEYSPQEFAELDIKAVPLPPLETATVDYRIYSIKVPDINDQIFFLDPDDLIYIHDPDDFTIPYEPPFVYIPDDPIAVPYDPPESIPWLPPFIRLPPIIICNSIEDTSSE